MSIQHFKTLVAIAEQGGFGAAAKAIFLSQSAVSLQMKSLEAKLQVKLFDRSKRPPTLNQTARELIPKARDLIKAYDSLIESVAGESPISGDLKIGTIPSTMPSLVPRTINALRKINPSLRILVSPEHTPLLMTQVDRGQIDAAVISESPYIGQHMEFKVLAEEPMVMLAPFDCKLDDPRKVLKKYPFIRFSRTLWSGQLIDNWLREEKISVNEIMEMGNHEMIVAMVYHNIGVSIVPSPCIPAPGQLALTRIPLVPPPPPRILGILSRRDNPNYHLINVFFEQLLLVVETEQYSNRVATQEL